MDLIIRLAKLEELETILEVERMASQRFDVLDIEIMDEEEEESDENDFGHEHREGILNERLWVALTPEQRIVGFALAQAVDQEGHLREIDVLQDYGRKGIGRALIQQVAAWCKKEGFHTLTLTTFKDVPWNGSYYEKLGFTIIDDSSLTGKLNEMIKKERARFSKDRVAMRKTLRILS